MDLINIIQQIVQQSLKAAQLTDMVMGTVVSVSPLEITINPAMAPLKNQILHLTSSVTGDHALEAGDKVIMLRVRNGQEFIVLSKTQ